MVNAKKKAISSIAVGLVAVSLIGFGGSTALGGFGTSTINASTATGVTAGFSQMRLNAANGLAGPATLSSTSGTITSQFAQVLSTLSPGAEGVETFIRVKNDSTTAGQTFQTSYEFVVKNAAGVAVTDPVAIAAILDSITINMSANSWEGGMTLEGFSLTASALNGTSIVVGLGGIQGAEIINPTQSWEASFDSVVSETLDSAYAGYSVNMSITIAGETV